jgi:uncharacterized protein YoxC
MNWEKRFTKAVGSQMSVVLRTIFFIVMLVLPLFGISVNTALLVLTTVVSLEAIYLAIFIQMTVNENTESLEEVEEDIDEIQHDVEEIQEDMGEIQEDVDEIQEDVDEIQHDVDEIQTNPGDVSQNELENIRTMLQKLLEEVDRLKTR